MSNEQCKCGHSRNEHFDFIEWITKEKLPYRQYFHVPKCLGKCQKCECNQFEKA